MKLEYDAILTCSRCGVEGPHELLYLTGHLAASRCQNCGENLIYSEHLYEDYVRDVAERTGHLPEKLASDAFRRPLSLALWPLKAAGKPLLLAREVVTLSRFQRFGRGRRA
ncbi:Hypothetical Protein RradSPS_1650 [Rubrobacter radiotolerans]|uniref:Uncharacterized protein n=1 Tax=Rubrobacter radiotolerans TaxID=42256 RepID=A0A023X3J8_RUBRA|nr:hypothetical protein [Rubrobacter radiotolerans]AHY46933.1 Hypothetical Protein RradSPS_1650 [Rubrobacter radiotolerans]MDX5894338.1 hypothetical protein [Rubrobacter radiotolerans]SMC05768.1 hypothetical protein SAMN00767673_1650 [Rubrobacter radiotolerans DSM 5868]